MVIAELVSIKSNAGACQKPVAGKSVAVATSATAIVAAEEAWKSNFSKLPQHSVFSPESVAQGEPYVAILKDGAWHVFGTLTKGAIGGTPQASICAVVGSVLATSHGQ